ncbi:putative gustatory receptor 28b [Uranotaenia lowii]|uniref:putative gustatory receptor 28b n=1 Tax=Uranotaenia lowii TaxID=190385 RepID=UPI002479411E|nr:putative gustatory receptor 28b [Uranotaenia lowii]
MNQRKWTVNLFRVTEIMAKLYGLFPLRFDSRVNRFQSSPIAVCWSATLLVGYGTGMLYVYIYLSVNVTHAGSSLNSVFMRLEFMLNYIFCIVSITMAILNRNRMKDLLNILLFLAEVINKRNKSETDSKLLQSYFRKILFIDVILKLIICCSYYIDETMVTGTYTALLNFIFMWTIALFTDEFVGLCLFVAHLYRMINLQIGSAVQQLCDFDEDQSYWDTHPTKKHRVCMKVASELDRLAHLHRDVTTVSKEIVKLVDGSLLFVIMWYFLIIIFGIFYAYTTLVTDLRNNISPTVTKYGSTIGCSVFEAFQFYYLVSGASLLTKRAEKTGLVLNKFFKTDVEERVERTINMFSMELLHDTYSVENFGMYKVDFTLIYSMVATITNYLIMMVQFQLAE